MLKSCKNAVLAAAVVLTSQVVSIANASADSVCFVLGEYDGRIALLEEGKNEPLAIYKTPIESLYPADADMLKSGIRVENRAELSKLIEDLDLE